MTPTLQATPPPNAWSDLKSLVLYALPSPHSRRVYGHALDAFVLWAFQNARAEGLTRALVQRYRLSLQQRGLSPSSVNVHLTAVRKLAAEAAEAGFLDVAAASGISKVKGITQKGCRLGRWLTREEAERLLCKVPAATFKQKRDRAILCLLISSGLRRAELAGLRFEHLQLRDGRWVIADLQGKRNRLRTIPIPLWTKHAVDLWRDAAKLNEGLIFRSVSKNGILDGTSLSPQAVYAIVRDTAAAAGLQLSPHDARRTFARLAHQGKVPLEQIQLSLGHDSILTTERYLGVRQDLADAPCDHLGLEVS